MSHSQQTLETPRGAPDGARAGHEQYALLTAAYNEEEFIEKVLQSVTSQTKLPRKWVIISDGSTDRTEEIVRSYAERFPFIQLIRRERDATRNFGSKARALNMGYSGIRQLDFQFVGNLDGDVSFGPDYFATLMEKMRAEPRLGIAGGYIHEEYGEGFVARPFNASHAVPHAVHFVRRECYDAMGGVTPLPYGGIDWCAEVNARMHGWQVRSFPELPVFHHRHTGRAVGVLRTRFRQGKMAYSLGSHPLFELLRGLKRLVEKPFVLGSLVRLCGYFYGLVTRERRPVSAEFVKFHRAEQKQRLRTMLHG